MKLNLNKKTFIISDGVRWKAVQKFELNTQTGKHQIIFLRPG